MALKFLFLLIYWSLSVYPIRKVKALPTPGLRRFRDNSEKIHFIPGSRAVLVLNGLFWECAKRNPLGGPQSCAETNPRQMHEYGRGSTPQVAYPINGSPPYKRRLTE